LLLLVQVWAITAGLQHLVGSWPALKCLCLSSVAYLAVWTLVLLAASPLLLATTTPHRQLLPYAMRHALAMVRAAAAAAAAAAAVRAIAHRPCVCWCHVFTPASRCCRVRLLPLNPCPPPAVHV
jgi:hypothetical protein